MNINKICTYEPIYLDVCHDNLLIKPDMKKVALQLAEYMLQNGFIFTHGPYRGSESDIYRYTFLVQTFKRKEDIP